MDTVIAALQGQRTPGIYRLTTALDRNQFAAHCQQAGWQCFILEGDSIRTKTDFLQHCAQTLQLPDYFGQNWDALADCLIDLDQIATRYVVLYTQPERFAETEPKQFEIALDVLASAVNYWSQTDTPMYVLLQSDRPVSDGFETL